MVYSDCGRRGRRPRLRVTAVVMVNREAEQGGDARVNALAYLAFIRDGCDRLIGSLRALRGCT